MKLIIADDSAVIRAILAQNLTKIPDVEIIASVSNGRRAIDSAVRERPDAVISDIDMPEMDGLKAAKILSGDMKIPVLILSENSSAMADARSAGASDFMTKPSLDSYKDGFFSEMMEKLTRIAGPICSSGKKSGRNSSSCAQNSGPFRILCIGASTGGPTAVLEVLRGLGNNFPLPVFYTQHIEIGADRNMVNWFDSSCQNISVRLAEDGVEALPGIVYMAPADRHLEIAFVKNNGHPVIKISDAPPERFLRPAVNRMFRSAANFYKKSCLAVLLTGMGRDGALGCRDICDSGGWTIVEDKSTCAVFGMPAAAIEEGGAREVLPRGRIAARIVSLVSN